MGVITNAPNGSFVGSGGIHEATRECVVWKNFMKNSGGFTVAGSAAPITGGMDGIDRIISYDDFIENSWFVIEAPDSSYQILVSKVGETQSLQRLFINFSSDWEGGAFGVEPTSPSNNAWYWGRNRNRFDNFTPNGIIYCVVEDQPPYRFIWVGTGHNSNELVVEGGMALITFSNSPPGVPNYGLYYAQGFVMNEWQDDQLKVIHPSYQANLDTRNLTPFKPATFRTSGTNIFPNGTGTIIEDYKFSIGRLPCGSINIPSNDSAPSFYFGEIEWIRFEGYDQSNYQMMDDAEWIKFGDTLFPWNGIAINKAKFS